MAAAVAEVRGVSNLWSSYVRCLHLSTFFNQLRFFKRPICTFPDYNPLLDQDKLPCFSRFETKHVVPAVEVLTTEFERDFNELENKLSSLNDTDVSWETVVEPVELVSHRLDYGWGIVNHMNGVRNSDPLRHAHQKVLPEVVKLSTKVAQSLPLYNVMEKLKIEDASLDEGQKRIITTFLRTARNGGVALKGNKKEKFNDIVVKLAELTTKFSNNVLDSKKQFSLILTKPEDVSGMPESLLQLTARAAAVQDKEISNIDHKRGPWKLTLDTPSLVPFLKYSDKRQLREQMYRANIAVASAGENNNSQIIEDIRRLRQEKSVLLGFEDYAALSLEAKMAGNAKEVWSLVHQLKEKSLIAAENDIHRLKIFAQENGFDGELQLWDLPYWSEKLRQHLFSFNDEDLRPYFPLPRVLDGLFKLSSELFGITIKAADGEAEIWHKDVKFFNIYNEHGGHIASFFLDPYSRPAEKQGGAWMNSCVGKSSLLNRRPVAYLVCNQTPPGGDGSPSLMTFRDVETLFHEFGHGLQHMLTTVKYSDAAGINNVEWDAVELPSQFMENWLYDKTTVRMVSGHYKTAEPLPDKLFQQICKARQFMAGTQMLRQLYFAALDLQLYTSSEPWPDVQRKISDEYTVLKPLESDRFPCSFLHIFSHGYAAGYYSYKWAEVMSADAFGAFKEVGLDNRSSLAAVGRRFRDTILASGGARHPSEVFQSFRGRAPTVLPLLEAYGLN